MTLFNELLSVTSDTMTMTTYLLSISSAVIMGIIFSMSIQYKHTVSQSFALTTALLPAVVSLVIMMVNGSIGAGIAVAGTFSLVRFRSVPGTAREILIIFIAMAIGLTCGMGSLMYGFIFTVLISMGIMILERLPITKIGKLSQHKIVRVTIPEDLDYTDVFSDLFDDFTIEYELLIAKSINLGSMFRLKYKVLFKDAYDEKEFLDQIRMRNGNLEVACSIQYASNDEL